MMSKFEASVIVEATVFMLLDVEADDEMQVEECVIAILERVEARDIRKAITRIDWMSRPSVRVLPAA
jgi:hypothetical protein